MRKLIDAIRAELRIAKTYLYLDRRTAISIGRKDLTAIEKNYSGDLSIYAVKTGRLFHTKGYCLAAYDGDDLVHGRLAIGSANLTSPGLIDARGNIESLAIHSDMATIGEFLEFFEDEDNLIPLQGLTDFSQHDATDFQYALLTSGWFSHKWSATLAAYFSVRYHLNEKGRQRTQEGIETPGFQTDAASIAKPYFDFDLQDWQSNDKDLVKNHGVECFLGHWIPKPVVHKNEENNERLSKFKTKLFKKLDKRMDRISRNILKDYESLIQEGIIDEHDVDPIQAFGERIEALRNDGDQLYRIWSGRRFFEFPYDLGDVKAIEETYDDILRTVRRRKKRNKAMKAILEAEEHRTLEPLQNSVICRSMRGCRHFSSSRHSPYRTSTGSARRVEVLCWTRGYGIGNGCRAGGANTALRLGCLFGISDSFGPNLQKLYELRRAEQMNGATIVRQPSLNDGNCSRAQVGLRLSRPDRKRWGRGTP